MSANLPLTDEFIKDVGLTGLSKQEEYANRERKMSVEGVDIRKFSNSRKGGMEPLDDPYYGRKPINSAFPESPIRSQPRSSSPIHPTCPLPSKEKS